MIYEIFNATTGETVSYWEGETKALATVNRLGTSYDYDPAPAGWYVVDMHGRVVPAANLKAPFYYGRESAQRQADMLNMASDHNSYRVV